VLDRAALVARLADVRARIARAAGRVGRDPSAVRLVAVSKTFSDDCVRAAAEAGQRDFGESKVQEAFAKMERTADLALRWHLIGHLQSNKARKGGARFEMIHSLDSVELGGALDRAAAAAGRSVDLLVQVALVPEPTKHGTQEEDLPALFEAARTWRSARVVGLMLLPPASADPENSRLHFRALGSVRDRLLDRGVPGGMVAELSMGMSHDFEVAVEEGATIVRVGTALFGDRAGV
jgi:pyridoxal phosphate enzyme (YggS family)